jgi:hypothetical protein
MTSKSKVKHHQPLEGEGSYSATRRYNQHLGDAVASGDLEAGAEEAAQALDGPEGEELQRAAEQAKKGPKQNAKRAATKQAAARR